MSEDKTGSTEEVSSLAERVDFVLSNADIIISKSDRLSGVSTIISISLRLRGSNFEDVTLLDFDDLFTAQNINVDFFDWERLAKDTKRLIEIKRKHSKENNEI